MNTTASVIKLRHDGRRFYITGTPFSAKNTLRRGGCHWDPDQRAWWTGKRDVAEKLVERLTAAVANNAADTVSTTDNVIKGRATYKGRSYYILAEGTSAKNGRRYAKLCSRDGGIMFWVKDFDQFELKKSYQNPRSIDGLRSYVDRAKQRAAEERTHGGPGCMCRCHDDPSCHCPGFCHVHFDGCEYCGCEND